MATWSTLHIHGYGETQLIGEDFNKKVLTSELTKAQAVLDNLYSLKPEEILATNEQFAANIIKNDLSIWTSKDGVQWRTKYSRLDIAVIEELVAEFEALTTVTEEVVIEEAPATEEAVAPEETSTVE